MNRNRQSSIVNRQSGFTLLELLVGVSILSILFLLLFVPLLTSMGLLSQGQGDIRIQDTLRTVMTRIERELKNAMFVYPNDGGSTTLMPFPGAANGQHPSGAQVLFARNGLVFQPNDRIRVGASGNNDYSNARLVAWVSRNQIGLATSPSTPLLSAHNAGELVTGRGRFFDSINADGPPQVTCVNALRAAVLSRLDFQLPQNLLSGGSPRLIMPLLAEPQLVTYYVRRRDPSNVYDEIDNPLVLYRAQYVQPGVNLGAGQDPCHVTGNAQSGWLRDSANLEPLAQNQSALVGTPLGLHTALTPTEDLNVIGRTITDPAVNQPRLVADTTFVTEDSNGDGRVDKVTINLVIGRYDAARRETVRETLRQTVALKNAK